MAADSSDWLGSTLVDAQVDLNPQQVEAALFAVQSPLSRGAILADEVGLGGAKAEAGAVWCKHASEYAAGHGGKPWKYLLAPHERLTEDRRLVDFYAFERKAS